ncbi:MAG: autotransporter domain-containing protein [Sulfuriferula sp.]|nr:autotransporter domain-containing protein [Sulfuriferula sp.]
METSLINAIPLPMKYTLKPLTVAVLLTLSGTAAADAVFTPMGFIPNDTASYSTATAVSANGNVAAGQGNQTAFIWSNGTMTNLGSLGGGSYSTLYALSSDGSTAVGVYYDINGYTYAFRWTSGTGMVSLGALGGSGSYATATSSDGSAVTGYAYLANNINYHAFRWSSSTNTMQDLGTLGGYNSKATAISADGSTVVGNSLYTTSNSYYHAFRWNSSTNTMQDLGTFGGRNSYATATSSDGSAVTGYAYLANNVNYHAFRWSSSTNTMQDLGSLGGNYSQSIAISSDGNAIAGYSKLANNFYHAFLWTTSTNTMQDLGTLGGDSSTPKAMSSDGSTVVGNSYTTGNAQQLPFRWTQATGMQSITTWLSNAGVTMPAGWVLLNAYAVNQDGTVVVGDGTDSNNNGQAWLARVGSGGNVLLTNMAAFNNSLTQTGSLTASNGIALPNITLFGAHHRSLMDDGLVHTDHGSCAWATTDGAHSNSTNSDTQITEAGGCKDIGDTRIGLGVGQNWSRQTWDLGGGGKFNGQYVVAEADHRFTGMGGRSMEASLLTYYGAFNTELHRNYMNGSTVDSSTGTPDMQSVAIRARLDWKDAAKWRNYTFSPYAAYTWVQNDVAAYTETGGGAPASYQASTSRTNDIRIGTAAHTELTAKTAMRIGAEVVHRMEGNLTGVNGQVIGLYSFSLPGSSIDQDWVRATLDFDHRLTKTTLVTFGANAATPGGDATWGLTAGLRAVF